MTLGLTESVVEDAALAWLERLGYAVFHGPEIAAGKAGAERIIERASLPSGSKWPDEADLSDALDASDRSGLKRRGRCQMKAS